MHPIFGFLPGRYGFNRLPGDDSVPASALLKMFDYPFPLPARDRTPITSCRNTPLSSFSNPYDLRGELVFGLDYRGMPLYERPSEQNVLINTAYELDLSTDSSRGMVQAPVEDMPFSVAELERLLRHDDVDAFSLPDRLLHLVDTFRNNPIARRGITTDSYDPRRLRSCRGGNCGRVRRSGNGSAATRSATS